MRFHYAGKYSGNPDDLPYREHEPGAVMFKEASDSKQLGKITTIWSIVLFLVLFVVSCIRAKDIFINYLGLFLYVLSIIPHELLHAICFREDVYMYQNLSHGMVFVTGAERMSKGRFIFKCMLPSIVLGFIPYAIFLIKPELQWLGTFGMLNIATAVGDYYNALNALQQMPDGAWAYMHKFNTYWYIPEKQQKTNG